jgi:autotransporter translocation and assembly factor TamB
VLTREFAWDKIYESAGLGSIESFKAKDKGLEALGMALHALEDIERHKGAVYGKGKANQHSLTKDVYPDAGEINNSVASVTNALIVHQVLNGNFKNAQIGTKIDIKGMTGNKLEILKSAVTKGGFELKQKEAYSTEYSIQAKPTEVKK